MRKNAWHFVPVPLQLPATLRGAGEACSGLWCSPGPARTQWMPQGNSLRLGINSPRVCGPQSFQTDMLALTCCLVLIRILTDFCNIILHILHSVKPPTSPLYLELCLHPQSLRLNSLENCSNLIGGIRKSFALPFVPWSTLNSGLLCSRTLLKMSVQTRTSYAYTESKLLCSLTSGNSLKFLVH